jgi:hypothetical protein
VISDVCDGTEWVKHEHLGSTASHDTRYLAWTGYADDVDIPNPIGTAAGHHKMTFIFTSLINRAVENRTSLANINLACIVLSQDLKEFTPAVVVSGAVDEPQDSHSLGACLRRFQDGTSLDVGAERIPFKGWLFNFVGDAPAMGEMCGTKASFSAAKNPCNMCENAHKPKIMEPCAWLECTCADDRNHDPGCRCSFASCLPPRSERASCVSELRVRGACELLVCCALRVRAACVLRASCVSKLCVRGRAGRVRAARVRAVRVRAACVLRGRAACPRCVYATLRPASVLQVPLCTAHS